MKHWHCPEYWKIYDLRCMQLDALEKAGADGRVLLEKTLAMIAELEEHEKSCAECED